MHSGTLINDLFAVVERTQVFAPRLPTQSAELGSFPTRSRRILVDAPMTRRR